MRDISQYNLDISSLDDSVADPCVNANRHIVRIYIMHAEFKRRGNEAYVNKEYSIAISLYQQAIEGLDGDGDMLSTIYSNMAACYIAMNQWNDAVVAAKRAVAYNGLNVKAQYRLASAVVSSHGDSSRLLDSDSIDDNDDCSDISVAGRAMAISMAVMPVESKTSDSAVQQSFDQLKQFKQAHLPRVASEIISVDSQLSFLSAIRSRQCSVVVIVKPGQYDASSARFERSMEIIAAVPNTYLVASVSHAILVSSCNVGIHGFALRASGPRIACSALCVTNGGTLRLTSCSIENYPDLGLLVDDGAAIVSDCKFTCKIQAIEVRNRSCLRAYRTEISDSKQGVIAYGGARDVSLTDCVIRNCDKEGILIQGTSVNAATLWQNEVATAAGISDGPTNSAAEVSKAVAKQSQNNGVVLRASVLRCTVSNCRSYGLSLDNGAIVTVYGCKIQSNAPYNCLVKGGTTLCFSANVVDHAGNDGVHVGINYGAAIDISHNCFCGKQKMSVVEEVKENHNKLSRVLYSRPATISANQHFKAMSSIVPSVDLLCRNANLTQLNVNKDTVQTPVPLANVFRISRTSASSIDKLYYAIGNTKGYNLIDADSVLPSDVKHVDILFAAMGDIRNLLATVSGSDPSLHITCVMNDYSVSILARNVLLLAMIERDASVDDVVAVWGSLCLSESQSFLCKSIMLELSNGHFPSYVYVNSVDTLEKLKEIYSSWCSLTMSLDDVRQCRASLSMDANTILKNAVKLSCDAIGECTDSDRVYLQNYLGNGNLSGASDATSPNATLMEAPDLQYNLYWSSSMYRAVSLSEDVTGTAKSSKTSRLYSRLLNSLKPQIVSMKDALSSGRLVLALYPGDYVTNFTFKLPLFLAANSVSSSSVDISTFDYIDCSNVSDYVSLPAAIQAGMSVLKTSSHCRLFAQSMQWDAYARSTEEFLDIALGMNKDIYQQLLGVNINVLQTGHVLELSCTNRPIVDKSECQSVGSLALSLLKACNSYSDVEGVTRKAGHSYVKAGGTDAGVSHISTSTLVHLLVKSLSLHAVPVIEMLCRVHNDMRIHRFECMSLLDVHLHQHTNAVLLSFIPKVDLLMMTNISDEPLVLVFTLKEFVSGSRVPRSAMIQVIDSLSYNTQNSEVRFVLTSETYTKIRSSSWSIVLAKCMGDVLTSVCKSVPLRDVGVHSFTDDAVWHMSCNSFVDKLFESYDWSMFKHKEWHTLSVVDNEHYVIVDVMCPVDVPVINVVGRTLELIADVSGVISKHVISLNCDVDAASMVVKRDTSLDGLCVVCVCKMHA